MLRNYLLVTWRNLLRHKLFSLINILGLAIGMAASLLIWQYVRFEQSYDRFHRKGDRIYRVGVAWFYPNGQLEEKTVGNFAAAGPALKKELPEVESVARFRPWFNGTLIRYGKVELPQDRIYFADPSVFSVFSFPVLQGDAAKALTDPRSAVLSESTARKYFGREDPLGKTIELKQGNTNRPFTVNAVFQDVPANAHFRFDVLLGYGGLGESGETDWGWSMVTTYLLLKAGTDPAALPDKFKALLRKYRESTMADARNEVEFILQPLWQIHLHSDLRNEPEPTGNGQTVYFLTLIGGLILLIAYANYVNLSTARAVDRAREVGLRKVVGASQRSLVGQFLLESLGLNAIAVALSLTFTQLFQAPFSRLAGLPQGLTGLETPVWLLLTGWMAGSLLAGIYPAFVLSSFQPLTVLKGKRVRGRGSLPLREGLTTLQFAVSIALLVGTMAVYRQLSFMRNQPLGLAIDQTLVVKAPVMTDSTYRQRVSGLKHRLASLATIGSVTASSSIPGQAIAWSFDAIQRKGIRPGQATSNYIVGVDEDFVRTYGLQVVAGRDFDRRFGTDRKGLLLNEEAARLMGFASSRQAVGQPMVWQGRGEGEDFRVIGVVKNFHQQGLRNAYEPIVLTLDHNQDAFYSCRVNVAGVNKTIHQVQRIYESFFPGNPFESFFLDEFYNRQYQAEQRFGRVFALFASLAILVACLGLLGMVSFTTTQRTKEIGIRKVLGASVSSLLRLLCRNFLRVALVANLIAWPVAYLGVGQWLQNYAFRIQLNGWLFILPSLLVVFVALLTIAAQTWKAARANPVQTLRYE